MVETSHVERLRDYADFVRSIKGHMLVEQRVDFSDWVPEGFGTADAVVMADSTLHVIDLKTGQGVRVDADMNSQLMLYALGSLVKFGLLFDFERINMVIHQPFLDHVSEFEISVDDLLLWADSEVKPAAELALTSDAPRVAGKDQCKWCKAKSRCREYASQAMKVVTDDFTGFETIEVKEAGDLSDTEIAAILEQKALVESLLKTIEETAISALMSGVEFPGFKLVAGRSLRKWRDEAEAETAIRKKLKVADAYTKKLISPAQAEKKLGKQHPLIDDLTVKPEGKPTLVPETDKRNALVFSTVEDDFSGIDTDAA